MVAAPLIKWLRKKGFNRNENKHLLFSPNLQKAMAFQNYPSTRQIEEEEFDDTELETPVRLNTLNIKRREHASGLFTSFRSSRPDDGVASNNTNDIKHTREGETEGRNDKSSPFHKNVENPDVLTIRSPPSLKFDKSVSLGEKHKERLRNQSPTPVTKLKPPTAELSPVDHSPVSYKVTKPIIDKQGNKRKKRLATETPLSKLDNDEELKQSILNRVNTTLESIKRGKPSDKVVHTAVESNNILPVNSKPAGAREEPIRPMYDFEADEPDFVHVPLESFLEPNGRVSSLTEKPDFPLAMQRDDSASNQQNVKVSPIINEDTLGNSTPLYNKDDLIHELNNGNEYDNYRTSEFELGADNTTWWTAEQWLKLMKVVNLRLISRQDAINSHLLMKELKCSSKEDLQRRYDFLKQYRTK